MHEWHRDLDLYLRELSECSPIESEKLVSLAAVMVSVATQVNTESILALENERNHIEDPLLNQSLELLIDGNDPSFISSCIRSHLVFGSTGGYEVRRMLIIGSGIHGIAQRLNPHAMINGLIPYIGLKYIDTIKNAWQKRPLISDRSLGEFIKISKSREPRSENSAILERIVPLIPNEIIEYLLNATPTSIFVDALVGASGRTTDILLNTASQETRESMEFRIAEEFWKGTLKEESTARCQIRILESIFQFISGTAQREAVDINLKNLIKDAIKSEGKTEIDYFIKNRALSEEIL